MPDETWSWREKPLLEIALREADAGHNATFDAMAEETGIDLRQVAVAMRALRDAGLVKGWFSAGDGGFISSVSPEVRERLGTWPSADAAVDRVVAALAAAADEEPDPERKRRLRVLAEGLAGVGRTVVTETLAAAIRQHAGLP